MIPHRLAEAIRREGFDVLLASTLPEEIFRDDEQLLTRATAERRVIFTCNTDDPQDSFIVLDAKWKHAKKSHAGIILYTQEDISHRRWEARERLLELLNERTWDEFHDQLLWLPSLNG